MRRRSGWPGLLLACAVAGAVGGCRSAPPPLPPVPAAGGPLLAPSGAAAVPDDQALVDRVVAVVNEDVITMSELQEHLILSLREAREAAPSADQLEALERTVLARMVDHKLQLQEARRERIEVLDEEVSAVVEDFVRRNGGDRARIEAQLRAQGLTWAAVRREFRDQLMVQKIRGRRVIRRATVTEAEVDAYVAENRGRLESALRYHARHIAVPAEPPDSPTAWERARAEIEAIAARLREGGDFAELARERSKDPSAESGGDLGWLKRGELQPLFEEPILRLAPGEVTAPIRSPVGYHLFRLEAREELTPEMLAQFRQQAREILVQRKVQARLDEWVGDLKRRALIQVRLGPPPPAGARPTD